MRKIDEYVNYTYNRTGDRFRWAKETFGYEPYTQVINVSGSGIKVLYSFKQEEEAVLFALKWA